MAGQVRADQAGWQFWIDRGGTFTDVVGRRPDGALVTTKLLSHHPERYRDAAIEGIRRSMGLATGAPIPAAAVEAVKMGTTVATNALLERKGEPTLLVTTRGFRDALQIGYQERPRLFDLAIERPERLYDAVVEADERLGADGQVVRPLREEPLRQALSAAVAGGLRSVAILFMHAYRNPVHERAAAALARAAGFTQVSTSHEVSPLIKYVGRGDTTVVDAYLSPILRRYVDQVQAELPGVPLYFMQSMGGLADAGAFAGKDAVLSGPAGGIVGMVKTAALAGATRVIGFDMGGTSTDVSHYAGEFERSFETQVAGVRMRVPMLKIHTVAAGGGSLLTFDGARMRVGPESAGADPGPTCYRRGGPLSLTDANVMLGKLQPAFFPAVFGIHGDAPIDVDAVRARFADLSARIGSATGQPRSAEAVAEGFVDIAVANMANAITRISVARGYDVTGYTLQCFGGAGGQHACRVAEVLGIREVLVHPLSGVLSAYGMGLADQSLMREASCEAPLTLAGLQRAAQQLTALSEAAAAALRSQHRLAATVEPVLLRRAHIRYAGTDTSLSLLWPAPEPAAESPWRAAAGAQDTAGVAAVTALGARFEAAHRKRFGFALPNRDRVIEAVSVEAIQPGHTPEVPSAAGRGPQTPARAAQTVSMWTGGRAHRTPVHRRDALTPGHVVRGPAIIATATDTVVVEPGWIGQVSDRQHLHLRHVGSDGEAHAGAHQSEGRVGARAGTAPGPHGDRGRPDPVRLEFFGNRFMNIAEQMGEQLRASSHSVNIKERLDFSCAIFDRAGQLVANAPHIPVHLGSMGQSVAALRDAFGEDMAPGDAFVVNDPYRGGTHLPDITVVTPVFAPAAPGPHAGGASGQEGERAQGSVLGFVGSRGHHADVGGLTPGSMPPHSRHIDEEGVRLPPLRLVHRGVFQEAALRERLSRGPYPARDPEQNLADLRAQLAANEKGVSELHRLMAERTRPVVLRYMAHVLDNAEEAVRGALASLCDGAFTLALDDGAQIAVRVAVDQNARRAVIDFAGTSAQQPTNFNAPRAVCVAAVLYVFRTLVRSDMPLNAGCLRPLDIRIPPGSMLCPSAPAAVVAGNVETSMCIANALYGALGVVAASQCTMNNVTFGDSTLQYYETLAGGTGAGPDFDGTDAVQSHMTNSRLTDPEVLELRFPVRLEAFEVRRGSGGRGRHRGGDGVVRRLRFLTPLRVSVLSNGRRVPAFGLAGGCPGAVGHNRVERRSGDRQVLGHVDSVAVEAGDVLCVETPGGGGYGPPPSDAQ